MYLWLSALLELTAFATWVTASIPDIKNLVLFQAVRFSHEVAAFRTTLLSPTIGLVGRIGIWNNFVQNHIK